MEIQMWHLFYKPLILGAKRLYDDLTFEGDDLFNAKRAFDHELYSRFEREYGYRMLSEYNKYGCLTGIGIVSLLIAVPLLIFYLLIELPIKNIVIFIGIDILLLVIIRVINYSYEATDENKLNKLKDKMLIEYNIKNDNDYLRWYHKS